MARKTRISPQERRALRLAAWGGTDAGRGFADAMDVWPPDPPADREAATQYHLAYRWGLERRGRRAAAGTEGG